jgi:hypothetical protein
MSRDRVGAHFDTSDMSVAHWVNILLKKNNISQFYVIIYSVFSVKLRFKGSTKSLISQLTLTLEGNRFYQFILLLTPNNSS